MQTNEILQNIQTSVKTIGKIKEGEGETTNFPPILTDNWIFVRFYLFTNHFSMQEIKVLANTLAPNRGTKLPHRPKDRLLLEAMHRQNILLRHPIQSTSIIFSITNELIDTHKKVF